MSRDDILRAVRAAEAQLRELGVRELSLFGSFARNEPAEQSDIDFVVEFEASSFDRYMAVKELLETLFSRRVDLVIKSAIKPRLRDRILGEAVRAA